MIRPRRRIFSACLLFALLSAPVWGQEKCDRFLAGSVVTDPENLYSNNGVLQVDFTFQASIDSIGFTRYCFVNSDGAQSPTLHVNPGDTLILTLTNLVPEAPGKAPAMPAMEMSKAGEGGCGAMSMNEASVNIHYHGTNTPPVCHQDEVIHTIINSGETFRYEVHFPKNEPPGLYWYHPHIHGMATNHVQGGATGAIIVEGIENVNPEVAGLPQRVIIIRDNPAASPLNQKPPKEGAKYDLSVNYIPVGSPQWSPARLQMKFGQKEFWRVVNSAAVNILDLALVYDGVRQPLEVIALDGVPIRSQDGSGPGKSLTQTHLLLPPAGRAEFIVTPPASAVQFARLMTATVDTGPNGDLSSNRRLIEIKGSGEEATPSTRVPAVSGPATAPRFAGLSEVKPTATRKLYFSEDDKYLYITVEGRKPKPYQMDDPPSIVTTQGSVEDWVIENRSLEIHEFHMHQIHFKLLARNGTPLPAQEQHILDTVNVPYWSGSGPYPSVTLRMDFRGPDVGDFVYHCHILDHEDNGMMAIIRVLPKTQATGTATTSSAPAALSGTQSLPKR